MVKHTQAIHRLLPKNCLSVFNHFEKLALKGLKKCIDITRVRKITQKLQRKSVRL